MNRRSFQSRTALTPALALDVRPAELADGERFKPTELFADFEKRMRTAKLEERFAIVREWARYSERFGQPLIDPFDRQKART